MIRTILKNGRFSERSRGRVDDVIKIMTFSIILLPLVVSQGSEALVCQRILL